MATHVGFADESSWNNNRFRSICIVSARADSIESVNAELALVVDIQRQSELKWNRIDGVRSGKLADQVYKAVVNMAHRRLLRVDVLIWDTHDSRHDVQSRDDAANLQRMLYHLFRNTLSKRWGAGSTWMLYLDQSNVVWLPVLQNFLQKAGVRWQSGQTLLSRSSPYLEIDFTVEELLPADSRSSLLLQVADLLAGIAAFSYEKSQAYRTWLEEQSPQQRLIQMGGNQLSNRDKARFPLLKSLFEQCRKCGMSIKLEDGLRTPNPKDPINFWLYVPQSLKDKAPTKGDGERI